MIETLVAAEVTRLTFYLVEQSSACSSSLKHRDIRASLPRLLRRKGYALHRNSMPVAPSAFARRLFARTTRRASSRTELSRHGAV